MSFIARGLHQARGHFCGALILFGILIAPLYSTFALYPNGSNDYAYIRSLVNQNLKEQPSDPLYVVATAYSSTADQTDATPCLTANNFNVCVHAKEDVIATNLVPLGTRVRFPQIDPDTIFTVVDRMHERYHARIDFWKTSRERAEKFGIRRVMMEVYE